MIRLNHYKKLIRYKSCGTPTQTIETLSKASATNKIDPNEYKGDAYVLSDNWEYYDIECEMKASRLPQPENPNIKEK